MKGILKRLEKGLEKAIETPFAKAFRSGVHPLEVGRRILRVLEDHKVLGVNEEVVAPHRFRCYLSRRDHERLASYFGAMSGEMEAMIIEYCRMKGYVLPSRPTVSFCVSDDLQEGEFEVDALHGDVEESPLLDSCPRDISPVSGRAIARRERRAPTGLLLVRGVSGGTEIAYRIVSERTSLGRATDNDLVLSDPKVSRHHAEVVRRPEGFVLRDLGSTNGTFVNGRRIFERLLDPGDVILLGDTRITFQLEGRGTTGKAGNHNTS